LRSCLRWKPLLVKYEDGDKRQGNRIRLIENRIAMIDLDDISLDHVQNETIQVIVSDLKPI
jgi:hypothetical protein